MRLKTKLVLAITGLVFLIAGILSLVYVSHLVDAAIQQSYDNNVTDEFIKPCVIIGADQLPLTTIKEGDAVLCFNFRTDRCRDARLGAHAVAGGDRVREGRPRPSATGWT